ncbi:gluconate 2-dehydrogenase subunit 3 family protein [Aquirufa sp. ROCK2-A2]
MNRRESIQAGATLFFAGFIGAEAFLSACQTSDKRISFSKEERKQLGEIAEIIIPATKKSPGAKAAKIVDFMQNIVSDCYTLEEQKIFMEGLASIPKDLLTYSPQQKWDFVLEWDNAASQSKGQNGQTHFFTMIKELTTWGYFTSEVGLTQELGYNPIPGKYVGCVEV